MNTFTTTQTEPAYQWWQFGGNNLPAVHGYGTRAEADR